MQKPLAALALAAASVLVLAGCSTSSPADDGKVTIVASTNVYGSLAAQIGGDRVAVTSLIDSAEKDPHSYEATARDRLAVQKADLVIENGGGYDAFMAELREGSDAEVITAAEFSHDYPDAVVDDHDDDDDHDEHAGHDHAEDADDHADESTDEDAHDHTGHDHADHSHIAGFNEHVWFDAHTMTHVAEQIADELTELDPEGEEQYTDAAKALTDDLASIESELDALHQAHEGQKVFITEPLPGLLAAAAGLDDVAPEGFAGAVEEGNDVAPAILLDSLSIIESRGADAVLVNVQTGGPETERIEAAATQAGIPIVAFSELLDANQSYADWMRAAISDLAAALEK